MNALSKQVGNRGRCLVPELAHRYFISAFSANDCASDTQRPRAALLQPWIVRQHPFDARRHLFVPSATVTCPACCE